MLRYQPFSSKALHSAERQNVEKVSNPQYVQQQKQAFHLHIMRTKSEPIIVI